MDYKNQYQNTNITSQTTTLVATGNGVLHAMTFNKPTATGTVALYDGVDNTGTLIATVTMPTGPKPLTLRYDVGFSKGLCAVTGVANQDITIMWAQG